jgi:zinc protease
MWFSRGAVLGFLGVLAAGCARPSNDSNGLIEPSTNVREEQRPLPTDPNVSVGTLDNGVKYVIQPWPNTGRATRLVLVVGAGSLDEGEDERGFAHFVEHVAMDPAQRFGDLAPNELLARVGATLDADSNAETHFANTQYFLTLQNGDAELIAEGLTALAGWASHVQFSAEVVDRQRPIVLAELRASEGQKGGLSGRLNGFLMEGLGIAERGPLGSAPDLQAATPPKLEAFYRRWYSPHNLTVVATGAFDRDTLREQIKSRFGALPSKPDEPRPGRRGLERQVATFSPGEASILVDTKDESLPGGFATLILQLPTAGLRFEHDYQTDLIDRYLCAVIEDRLRQASRGRFECTPARPSSGQVQLRVRAWAAPGALRTTVEAMLVELQRSLQHGFLESELRRVQPRILGQIAESAQRAGTLRESSRELVKYAQGEQAMPSAIQKQELETRLLATIRPTALEERTRQWLTGGRRLLAAVREEGDDSLASEQALADLMREIASRSLPPPSEPPPAIELMPVLPEPGKITQTERVAEPDLHRWTLDNGARVTFKRARKGAGKALLRGLAAVWTDRSAGAEKTSDWNRLYAPQIVQKSGAGAHDAESVSRVLSTRTTRIHLGADVEASSSVGDFESTLQLLHLYLTSPRHDPQAFEQLVSGMQAPPEPRRAFLDAMFPEVDPRIVAEQLNLDAALKAYRERFASFAGVEFLIVADLEEDLMRGLVERYLASLPGSPIPSEAPLSTSRPRAAARAVAAPSRGGIHRVRLENRPGAESQVVLRFTGTAAPSPEARVDLEALKAYLRLRLRDVLRGELGAIYDADITSGWSGNDPWLEIRFDCKPGDVEKLRRVSLDIIAGIDRPGISDADLDALRAQYSAQFSRAFQDEGFWLEELSHAYREGAPAQRILELPKLSARFTREGLRRAARHGLPLDRYVDAVWSPAVPAGSL